MTGNNYITDFRNQKACVFGIQGSGKTFFTRHRITKYFKKPLIFVVNHDDGWQDIKGAYVWLVPSRETISEDYQVFVTREFNKFIEFARRSAIEKKIDCIVVDEADLFFQTNHQIRGDFQDLILNHRHMGVALWFLTRRPQDIPTKTVEQCKFMFIFKVEGKNAIQRFYDINPLIPPLIERIDFEKHDYVFKEIGKQPIIRPAIKVSEKKLKKTSKK